MAHRLAGVAAGLCPGRVGDRIGQAHRNSRRGGIDDYVIFPAQHRNALAEDGRLGLLATLERAAPARSQRCGNHKRDAETFRCRHSWSYWAWLESAVLMSTPNEAASWVARSRMELGTVLSLAMAANSWPASRPLPRLASAIAVISPALPNHGSPGLARGSSLAITSWGWSWSNSSAVCRMRAASRYG